MMVGDRHEAEMVELRDRHEQAMREFDRRVRGIADDRWGDPTPCTDWDVRTVVHHLVTEQRWVPLLLGGATLEEVGDRFDGDQLGDDPVAAWDEASAAARAAVVTDGALDGEVSTSSGTIPARVYVEQLTLDLAVHAWDLARATGGDECLDADLVADLLDQVDTSRDELDASGLFAPPRPTAPTADEQTKLLALLGRSR